MEDDFSSWADPPVQRILTALPEMFPGISVQNHALVSGESFPGPVSGHGDDFSGDLEERILLLFQKELDRRRVLFNETENGNVMEYNRHISPEKRLKKRFVTIPCIRSLSGLAMYAAARLLYSGIPAGIDIAIGAVRGKPAAEFQGFCVEITPPAGTNPRLHWFAAKQSFYNQKAGRK